MSKLMVLICGEVKMQVKHLNKEMVAIYSLKSGIIIPFSDLLCFTFNLSTENQIDRNMDLSTIR